jgi:hypothetical protein
MNQLLLSIPYVIRHLVFDDEFWVYSNSVFGNSGSAVTQFSLTIPYVSRVSFSLTIPSISRE